MRSRRCKAFAFQNSSSSSTISTWSHVKAFAWRPGAAHHGPENLVRDYGERPSSSRSSLLLSRDFRYFGAQGSPDYKARLPLIKEAVERLGPGIRVSHDDALSRELFALKDVVWTDDLPQTDGMSQGRLAQQCSTVGRRCAGGGATCGDSGGNTGSRDRLDRLSRLTPNGSASGTWAGAVGDAAATGVTRTTLA